jgi:WD40 repeat protein
MKLQSAPLDDQKQYALGDDGELIIVQTIPTQRKMKRKRKIGLITRGNLLRALKQIMVIGLPISLFIGVVLLQANGVIALQMPDGKLHLEHAQQCASFENYVAMEVYGRTLQTGNIAYIADKDIGVTATTANNGISNLYLLDSKKILQKQLTQNDRSEVYYEEPQWSPDGNLIAYNLVKDKSSTVYVMNADGSNVRALSGDFYAKIASWSPDSKLLTFAIADRAGSVLFWIELYSVNIEGSDMRKLVSANLIWPGGAKWSPNGQWIAINSDRGVNIISPNGQNQRQILPTPASVIMWTLDGKYLILSQNNSKYAVNSADFANACRISQ